MGVVLPVVIGICSEIFTGQWDPVFKLFIGNRGEEDNGWGRGERWQWQEENYHCGKVDGP